MSEFCKYFDGEHDMGELGLVYGPSLSAYAKEGDIALVNGEGAPRSMSEVPTGAEDLAADYARAVEHVCKTKKATLSSFQFDLGFGFMRALSILERMEQEGLVGPCDDKHPRSIHWDRSPKRA